MPNLPKRFRFASRCDKQMEQLFRKKHNLFNEMGYEKKCKYSIWKTHKKRCIINYLLFRNNLTLLVDYYLLIIWWSLKRNDSR